MNSDGNERVNLTISGHVAEVMLARPGKRNAVDLPMFEALARAAQSLGAEPAVRAVVLAGSGGHFCAGIDLGALAGEDRATLAGLMQPGSDSPANLFQQAAMVWRELPVPVVCAISGVCFGAGLQIALGADLRYAAPDARLSVMEVRWGLVPDMAISVTSRGVVPLDRLRELTYSGRIVDGREAAALGLVTGVADDPLEAARQCAADIATRSPDAVRAAKSLYNRAPGMSPADALSLEAALQAALLGSPNQLEAMGANREDSVPRFRDPGERGRE